MVKGVRYTTRYDPEGVTPSRLKRFGRERQLEYMEAWFRTYYEDPERETPVSEGEYVFSWGGPYSAVDELHHEFGSFIDEDRIGDLVVQLERKGTMEWAPTGRHPDQQRAMLRDPDEVTDDEPDPTDAGPEPPIEEYVRRLQRGARPRFGSDEERASREVFQERIAGLRELLDELRRAPVERHHGSPLIGHNNPPPDEPEDAGAEPTLSQVMTAVEAIASQLRLQQPDALKVGESVSLLGRMGKWWRGRADKLLERTTENAIGFGVVGAGTIVANHYVPGGIATVSKVMDAGLTWFGTIMPW